MKPSRSVKILSEYRRIFVMILLFTLCGISLIAQKTDSIQNIIDTTELKPLAPGQEAVRNKRVQPRTGIRDEQLPDSLQTNVFLADTLQKNAALSDTTHLKGRRQIKGDSALVDLQDMEHSPKKAMIYSIVLPGAGQAYNKKYWKIPIVYAALGGAGYAIWYNTQAYRTALANYGEAVLTNDPDEDRYKRYAQYTRRNLEISYIALVAVDALAVVDAYVDAHLFFWDVSPDLTLRMEPSIQPLFQPKGTMMNAYGLRASFTF